MMHPAYIVESMFEGRGATGWFYARGDKIHGPTTLAEITLLGERQDILISRRGFDRWYSLDAFVDLCLVVADRYERDLRGTGVLGEKVFSLLADGSVAGIRPRVIGRSVGPETRQDQVPVLSKVEFNDFKATVAELRLGTSRKVTWTAVLSFAASLGMSWFLWYRTAYKEVRCHMYQGEYVGSTPVLLAMVPGAHFFAVWVLARMIRGIEAENYYEATSPALATVLALIPPLAMMYLQESLNHHWEAHLASLWQQRLK